VEIQFNMNEICAWYGKRIGKDPASFDERDRKAALTAYLESLGKAVGANKAPDKSGKKPSWMRRQ
jgi:hypothetical protein